MLKNDFYLGLSYVFGFFLTHCWHIHSLVNWVIIGSGNGLSPVHCQAFNSLRPSICVSKLGHHWFKWWLVTWPVPSHYLNHCWNIVNWTLGVKFQLNFNQNAKIFIRKNAFKNVICKVSFILFWPLFDLMNQWWLIVSLTLGKKSRKF